MNSKWKIAQKINGYRIYQQYAPISGFLVDCPKYGINIQHFLYFQKQNYGYLYYQPDEYSKIGAKFFKQFLSDQTLIENSISKIFKYSDILRKFSSELKNINLDTLSDKNIIRLYNLFHKHHSDLWRMAMVPNILEFENSYLTDYLMSYLSIKEKNRSAEIFSALLSDQRKSEQQKRDANLIALINYVKEKRNKYKNYIFEKDPKVKRFYSKYSYLTYNWSGPVDSFKEFLDEIKEMLKKLRTGHAREKHDIKDTISIDDYHLKLFKILADIIFSKSYRMDASYYAYFNLEKLFKEISKRLNLSVSEVQSIPPSEMGRILIERRYKSEEITDFYNLGLFLKVNKKIIYISGEKAKIKLDKILPIESEAKRVNILKGQVAFPGRVKGVAKIINVRGHMSKFKKNDILVSAYTDPTLMPIIGRAKAIVTDVGGLTCHAAIVSRELRKPCVVGTKVATQVINDGDLIEVDANKGVVTILKRA